jgi:hypothetical protein
MSRTTAADEPNGAGSETPLVHVLLRARPFAMLACMVGGGASLAFMYRVGHRNPSFVLMLLFTVWVLSPFVALLVGAIASAGWAVRSRAALHGVMLAVSFLSPVAYGIVALGPPRPRPAFVFLVVPLASWCLGAGAVAIASFFKGRLPRA